MPYCRNCGAVLEENASFCPKCGTSVPMRPVERTERVARERRPISPLTIWAIAGLVVVVVVALIAIPLLLGGFLPFGQVVGSGNVRTENRNFSDFTVVEVSSGFQVQVTQASSYTVSITADDNIFNYIEVTKTGSALIIRLRPGFSFQTTTLRALITMPDLEALQFSGGTRGTVSEFVMSHDFRVELSGGSSVTMEGEANNLVANASGGSNMDLSDFHVANAQIVFSGGSRGTINLSGRLDADLSGGSRLFYIGNPTLGSINTSGGSTVSPA